MANWYWDGADDSDWHNVLNWWDTAAANNVNPPNVPWETTATAADNLQDATIVINAPEITSSIGQYVKISGQCYVTNVSLLGGTIYNGPILSGAGFIVDDYAVFEALYDGPDSLWGAMNDTYFNSKGVISSGNASFGYCSLEGRITTLGLVDIAGGTTYARFTCSAATAIYSSINEGTFTGNVEATGSLTISGGRFTSVVLLSGASMTGGISDYVEITNGTFGGSAYADNMIIYAGGTMTGGRAGTVDIHGTSSGGFTANATVKSGGYFTGGYAEIATVQSGGYYSGGHAVTVTVQSAGFVTGGYIETLNANTGSFVSGGVFGALISTGAISGGLVTSACTVGGGTVTGLTVCGAYAQTGALVVIAGTNCKFYGTLNIGNSCTLSGGLFAGTTITLGTASTLGTGVTVYKRTTVTNTAGFFSAKSPTDILNAGI